MDNDARKPADDRREGEAVVNARHRVALLAETVGTRHAEYATGLNQLALLLIMQGEPSQAEPLLREALEVRRDTLGESHPDYATNLSSLGGLLWARGAMADAEPLLRRAAEIRLATLGPGHPKTVVSLNSLEQLLQARANEAAASSVHVPPIPIPGALPSFAPTGLVSEIAIGRSPTPPVTISISKPGPLPSGPLRVVPGPTPPEPRPLRPVLPVVMPAVASLPAVPVFSEVEDDSSNIDRLAAELETIRGDFDALAERYRGLARNLVAGRLPETAALADDTAALRLRHESVHRRLAAFASDVGAPLDLSALLPVNTLTECLPELRTFVSTRRKAAEQRSQAIEVLRRVDALTCASDPGFTPLTECREQASRLIAEIESAAVGSVPEVVSTLLDGSHAFSGLLGLVRADDDVDDARWAAWFDQVEAAFGASLAVAAARNRITSTTF